MLVAFVWHWWISVFLLAGCVLGVFALAAGYLVQVERPQFPKGRQRRQRTARR